MVAVWVRGMSESEEWEGDTGIENLGDWWDGSTLGRQREIEKRSGVGEKMTDEFCFRNVEFEVSVGLPVWNGQ